MKRFVTRIINTATGKRYVISTVALNSSCGTFWQTAVFKQYFGPFFAFFKPALFLGTLEEAEAEPQHRRVEAIVRNLSPDKWETEKWTLLKSREEEESHRADAERDDIYRALLKMTGTKMD